MYTLWNHHLLWVRPPKPTARLSLRIYLYLPPSVFFTFLFVCKITLFQCFYTFPHFSQVPLKLASQNIQFCYVMHTFWYHICCCCRQWSCHTTQSVHLKRWIKNIKTTKNTRKKSNLNRVCYRVMVVIRWSWLVVVLDGSVCCQRQIPAVRIKCSNWHFGDTCTMVYDCNEDRRRIQVIIKIMEVKYFPFHLI